MDTPLLAVRNLEVTYKNGTQALKDVSLDVRKGEFVIVIGLSGSGKSTLLRSVNHLVVPTSGNLYFDKQDVSGIQGNALRSLRKDMAMIFQQFNLIPRRSVLSNVLMGRLGHMSTWASLLGLYSSEDRKEALAFLKLVGLDEKAWFRADSLSGGQQQRVAIARALMQKPKLLLADEPVASLDPVTSQTVMSYLKKINQQLGITVICNLHSLSLARQYGTRIVALKEGRVVYDGKTESMTSEWFEKIYGESSQEDFA